MTMCRVYFILTLCTLLAVVSTYSLPVDETRKALEWLVQQRQKDWGWGMYDTPQALLAVRLTHTGAYLERELSTKQLEVELVLQLWRHHEKPTISPGVISLYSMALSASCRDPRQFYGHDLIGSLLHPAHELESDSEFTMCALAVCNSGAHVRKKLLLRLLNIANSNHTVDSLAGVILALQCIMKVHRNRNVQHYLGKPTLALARLQQADGGFGSLHNTAFALQALSEEKDAWNRSAAVSWLLSHQGPDGAFFDVTTTSEVILALAGKSLMSVRETDCDSPPIESETPAAVIIPHLKVVTTVKPNTTGVSTDLYLKVNKTKKTRTGGANAVTSGNGGLGEGEGDGEEDSERVRVTYTLWVGTNVTESHNTSIEVNYNSTFYNVMQIAALKDSHYSFSANEWPNGHYVHTLNGLKEEPMSYHYWLLYRLPSRPDVNQPPGNQLVAPTGVDDLIVQDNEHYLFWYKKL